MCEIVSQRALSSQLFQHSRCNFKKIMKLLIFRKMSFRCFLREKEHEWCAEKGFAKLGQGIFFLFRARHTCSVEIAPRETVRQHTHQFHLWRLLFFKMFVYFFDRIKELMAPIDLRAGCNSILLARWSAMFVRSKPEKCESLNLFHFPICERKSVEKNRTVEFAVNTSFGTNPKVSEPIWNWNKD